MNRKDFYKAVSDYEANFLSHHGVKHQQWGVRHGPPYPINGEGVTSIKKGSTFQRISANVNDNESGGHAYVTYNGKDNDTYAGKFAYGRNWGNKDVYKFQLKAKEDLKGPGKSERLEVSADICNTPEGKEAMTRASKEYGIPFVENATEQKDIVNNYRLFTKAIGGKDSYLRETYFNELKNRGYNMVQDDYDRGLGMGKYPTIIFDREKSLEYQSHDRVGMAKSLKTWITRGGKDKDLKNETWKAQLKEAKNGKSN